MQGISALLKRKKQKKFLIPNIYIKPRATAMAADAAPNRCSLATNLYRIIKGEAMPALCLEKVNLVKTPI